MLKKLLSVVFCGIALFSASGTLSGSKAVINAAEYSAPYSAEIVMEVNTGRVVYASNEHTKKYMASTTKILTAITVIENCDLAAKVTVGKETVGVEGSSIYLEAGEELTVEELLYGLMLRSGNDAAETLAVFTSGSVENFAALMNETASRIGAVNSHFVNPHGLHNDEHYTTAYDLALITCHAMKNEKFREIAGAKTKDISWSTREYKRHLVNKNKLLFNLEGCTGVKTGFTKKAGRCLVSSCKRGDTEFVCVVLNCPPMFERSAALLENVLEFYKNIKVLESDNIYDFIDVAGTDEKCGVYIKNDVILPLTVAEAENLKIVNAYPDKLEAPFKKDEEIGFIEFYCQNNLIFREKVYTIIGMEKN